jgi:DNA invertase Pin-like site-specific DNA recombinase
MTEADDGYNIGYARNIGSSPSLAQQIESLERVKCHNIYVESKGNSEPERSELEFALQDVRDGDTFVVEQLICISHSTEKIKSVMQHLQRNNVGLRILDDPIGAPVTYGNSELEFLLGLIDLKSKQRSEETLEGLAAARKLGRRGGRPIKLSSEVEATARGLLESEEHSMSEIAHIVGVSRSSLYNLGLSARNTAPQSTEVSLTSRLAPSRSTKK